MKSASPRVPFRLRIGTDRLLYYCKYKDIKIIINYITWISFKCISNRLTTCNAAKAWLSTGCDRHTSKDTVTKSSFVCWASEAYNPQRCQEQNERHIPTCSQNWMRKNLPLVMHHVWLSFNSNISQGHWQAPLVQNPELGMFFGMSHETCAFTHDSVIKRIRAETAQALQRIPTNYLLQSEKGQEFCRGQFPSFYKKKKF